MLRIMTYSALLERTHASAAECLQVLADHTVGLVPREQGNILNDVTSPQHVEIGRPSLVSAVQ